jgi:RNA-directed DNA polymerase
MLTGRNLLLNVGEMQRKLSLWAEQDKEHRFFDLYHLLYDNDWLRLAHDYVAQNAGSVTAGCDGINMKLFDANLEENLQEIINELRSESFEPHPVRRVHIPKSNGKFRPLGIPSIKDRIVQEALRMILEPIYEADFSQNSFGFRPNRRTMDAVKYIATCTLPHQRYFWIIEGDISSYFDTINHRRLVKVLRRRIKDEKILRLIWKFLKAGVMEGKLFRDTKAGTPQGGIISPLLANIYLNELDKYMEKYTGFTQSERHRRRVKGEANFIHVRYADDFVVLCNGTKAQAEGMKERLQQFLDQELKLRLSEEKTRITHLNDGFKFLGYWIQRSLGSRGMVTRLLIPKEAADKFLNKIKDATAPSTHKDSVNFKILSLNRIISGWCQYYQYTSRASSDFHKVSYRAFWYMGHWLGRKFQRTMPQVMKQFYKDNTFVTDKYHLRLPKEFSTAIYKASVRKPNPYTMREAAVSRESLPLDTYWTGYEKRPGWADLRPQILKRDNLSCQICDKQLTDQDAEVDHIKPFRKFKRPINANAPENLWTLCKDCHTRKTENDRKMESRVQ